jgi:hypothetical protein
MPPTPVSPPVSTQAIASSSSRMPVSTPVVASTPVSTSSSAGVVATPFPASTSTLARNVSTSPSPSRFESALSALLVPQRTRVSATSHHMVTRAKAGQLFPNKKYAMVAATASDLSRMPPLSARHSPIPIGGLPHRQNMMPCSPTGRGPWCLIRHVLMPSPANGCSSTNSNPTRALTSTRLDGCLWLHPVRKS